MKDINGTFKQERISNEKKTVIENSPIYSSTRILVMFSLIIERKKFHELILYS